MDQRPSFWPSVQNLKALEAQIRRLFCASSLRHTLRSADLLRLKKLLNKHCKRRRSRGTPPCPVLSGTKSRCTSSGCHIISREDDLGYPTLFIASRTTL